MKKLLLVVYLVLFGVTSAFGIDFEGSYMCGPFVYQFENQTITVYEDGRKVSIFDYSIEDEEWNDVEGQMGFILSEPGKDSKMVTFTAENSDEFFIHEIGDVKYLPSLHFRKVEKEKIYKDKIDLNSLSGVYVDWRGANMATLGIENNKINEYVKGWKILDGTFKEIPKKDSDPKESTRILVTEEDGEAHEYLLMERIDNSLCIINGENHIVIFDYVRLDDTARFDKEKAVIEATEKKRDEAKRFTNADLNGAVPLDFYGIYADNFDIVVYHFQGDLLVAYVAGVPLNRHKVFVKGDIWYLEPVSDAYKRGWMKVEIKNNGNFLKIQSGDGSTFTLTKREPGTITTLAGTLY